MDNASNGTNCTDNMEDMVVVPMTANELHKMSPLDIVALLIAKKISPLLLNKGDLIESAGILRGKGCGVLKIAKILEVDKRTTFRYLEQFKKKNAIIVTADFQSKCMGEIATNLDEQYDRLIESSYDTNLSASERIKAIVAACQVMKCKTELFERLGYLNSELTKEGIKQYITQRDDRGEIIPFALEPWRDSIDKLTFGQLGELVSLVSFLQGETNDQITKQIKGYLKENKESENRDTEKMTNPNQS
ncbi:MAG: hypothetical protein ABR913_05575 [Sedimentisphaerales bacterium]